MELNKENLPRFKAKTGVGVCQNVEFRTEDHPLPAWCYWTYKDNCGRYGGILIQMRTPRHWKVRQFCRGLRLDWYDSLEAAITDAADIILQCGQFMYGAQFAERYQEAMSSARDRTPAVALTEADIDRILASLTLPEGLYARKIKRSLVNGGEQVGYRIVATWREGPVRWRRQRERVFRVYANRSLEQAIDEATQHRQAMLEEHGVYDSPYSDAPSYPNQSGKEHHAPRGIPSEAEIDAILVEQPLPAGLAVRKVRRRSVSGNVRVHIAIAAAWWEGSGHQRRRRECRFSITPKRSLQQAIKEATEHRQAMLEKHGGYENAHGDTPTYPGRAEGGTGAGAATFGEGK